MLQHPSAWAGPLPETEEDNRVTHWNRELYMCTDQFKKRTGTPPDQTCCVKCKHRRQFIFQYTGSRTLSHNRLPDLLDWGRTWKRETDKKKKREEVNSHCLNAESMQHVHHILCGHIPRSPLCIWTPAKASHWRVHNTDAHLQKANSIFIKCMPVEFQYYSYSNQRSPLYCTQLQVYGQSRYSRHNKEFPTTTPRNCGKHTPIVKEPTSS